MRQVTLYRDNLYGALVISEPRPGIIETVDHGFAAPDFEAFLQLLEMKAKPKHVGKNRVHWKYSGHRLAMDSALKGVARRLGYKNDALAERAVMQVSESYAAQPDLPAANLMSVDASIEHGFEALSNLALRVLDLNEATYNYVAHPRPYAKDAYGIPLPFLRIAIEGTGKARLSALREAFSQIQGVCRVTVTESQGGKIRADLAFALPRQVIEDYRARALPDFPAPTTEGCRTIRFSVDREVPNTIQKSMTERATSSNAAAQVEFGNRIVSVKVPCTESGGEMMKNRLRWLRNELSSWGATLEVVGPFSELQEA